MGKRSAADKAATHDQILKRAAQAFLAHGSNVGIGEVMKELGLTRGGFYRHFESKDELLVEAVSLSLAAVGDRLEGIAESAPPDKTLEAIIRAYLSSEHLLHPETWCALAAMAPDLGRQTLAVRKKLDNSLRLYMERMAKYMPGSSAQEQRKNFILLFSGMAGVIAMVRAFGDQGMRDQVLGLAREYYLKTFAPNGDEARA